MDIINVLNFKMYVPKSNTDGIFKSLRLRNIWEEDITNVVQNNLKDVDTFIDIGANIGYYTLLAKSCNVSRCYAFEPESNNYQLLKKNIELNRYEGCDVFNYGLGSVESVLPFNYNDVKSGHGSFYNPIKEKQKLHKEELKKIVSLDSMNIDGSNLGVKLDVEGYELEVLVGMTKLIESSRVKFMVIEISPKFYGGEVELEIIDLLKKYFKTLKVIETNGDLKSGQGLQQYNILAKT